MPFELQFVLVLISFHLIVSEKMPYPVVESINILSYGISREKKATNSKVSETHFESFVGFVFAVFIENSHYDIFI